MLDVPANYAPRAQVVFYDDDVTPVEFVQEVLRRVFDASSERAAELIETLNLKGMAVFGVFPSAVAEAFVEAANDRIGRAGQRLVVKATPVGAPESEQRKCGCCGEAIPRGRVAYSGAEAPICESCLVGGAAVISEATRTKQFKYAHEALSWHFVGVPKDQLIRRSS
jgi:ATP-dependent Clp protease adapter protein ClpS